MLNRTIGVRVERQDHKLLINVCKARGEDVSDFIRRAVRKELASLSFYNAFEKKALGITVTEP